MISELMNVDQKWIKVVNSKDCGVCSGNIFNSLSEDEKENAKSVMMYRAGVSKDSFFVRDSEMARKLFDGFYVETQEKF